MNLTQKKIEAEKNNDKDGKTLYKNGQSYIRKNNEKSKKYDRCKTTKQQKRRFKMFIKTKLFMSHNILDNNLVVIRKSKIALKLNKAAYIGMCILQLSKVY